MEAILIIKNPYSNEYYNVKVEKGENNQFKIISKL